MKRIGLLILSALLAGCSSSAGSPGVTAGASDGDVPSAMPSVPFDVISVPFGIYVGLVYTGAACSPNTNSGYFSTLAFDSVFHSVVFAQPSADGLPGPMGGLTDATSDSEAEMTFTQVHGEGKVSSFNLCPMYETDTDSYPCKVTDGPNDFEVSLAVVAPRGDAGSATLQFQAFSAVVGQPILRWDGQIGTGEWGGVGGAETAFFTTTWADLMAGAEFAFETTVPGDDGESWHWSVRFMPEVA